MYCHGNGIIGCLSRRDECRYMPSSQESSDALGGQTHKFYSSTVNDYWKSVSLQTVWSM